MILPSASRRLPADRSGPCRRMRCPTASYTTLGDTISAFSWTTNREKGERFAQRFAMLHKRPALLSGTVRKRSVWAVELGRGEDEILCHPQRVSNLRQELQPTANSPSETR